VKKLSAVAVLMILIAFFSDAKADVDFTGNYVQLVEVRTAPWGDFLIITIVTAAGGSTRKALCDAAPGRDNTAMAISLSDPAAKQVQASATLAKLLGTSVNGWSLSQTTGSWCTIASFVLP
jgi:hypothetical protein